MFNNPIFHIDEIISIPSGVAFFRQINDELIIFIDINMVLHKINAKEYKIFETLQLDIKKDEVIAISADNKNEIIYSKKGGGLTIYDINNNHKKEIDLIFDNDILDIRFSRDSQYFVTKCTKGNISVFDNKLKKFIYTINNQTKSNLIKHFFSLDSQILVLIYEDGTVIVFDTFSHETVAQYTIKGIATDGFVYSNNKKIFITISNGEYPFCSYDVVTHEFKTSKANIKSVTSCYTDKTHTTVICGTESGMVFLINLSTLEIIYNFVFDSSTSKVFINDSIITILLKNNQLYFFDKNHNLSQALIKLELKEFKHAFDLISENIFLYMNPKILKHLNQAWDELFKRAVHFIGEDKLSLSLKMLEPFFAIKSKKDAYNYAVENKQYAIYFNDAVKEGNLKEAYELAKEYEFLQSSLNYIRLESNWDEAFMKAEKLLSQKISAEQILTLTKPYLEVPQKHQIISEMIKNSDIFIKAEDAIKNRQFYLFYKYCEKFPALRQSTFGRKADELGVKLYEKLLMIPKNSAEFDSLIEYLKHFPDFKQKAESLKTESAIGQMFTKAQRDDNIKLIYHLIHANPFLKQTNTYKVLIADTEKDFQQFTAIVYEKGFESGLKLISRYFSIDMLSQKVYDYMKLYYLIQVKMLDSSNLQLALENYKKLFGEDNILHYIAKEYKLNIPTFNKVNQTNIKFHSSILDYK